MIFTDYYKFLKLPNGTKTRLDCVCSTKSYDAFELLRPLGKSKGVIHIRLVSNYTNGKEEHLWDWALTAPKPIEHITSLCKVGTEDCLYYGDFRGTTDAMIILPSAPSFIGDGVIDGTAFEIFIARGHKADMLNLFNECIEGELEEEMNLLRESATTEGEVPIFC